MPQTFPRQSFLLQLKPNAALSAGEVVCTHCTVRVRRALRSSISAHYGKEAAPSSIYNMPIGWGGGVRHVSNRVFVEGAARQSSVHVARVHASRVEYFCGTAATWVGLSAPDR
jgi:hypothetical protein